MIRTLRFEGFTRHRWRVATVAVLDMAIVLGLGAHLVNGALPQGLQWGDEVNAVWARLGQPGRVTGIYGTPTLVYMFEGERYGSLELRFDAGDHLMRVNASLVR